VNADESLVYAGPSFSIEWGQGPAKECQAREYYYNLDEADRAKALALFKRMACTEGTGQRTSPRRGIDESMVGTGGIQ
jgi:hypothetical protein